MATATETPLCGAPTKRKNGKCRQPVPSGVCQYHGLRHAAVRQLMGPDDAASAGDANAAQADPFGGDDEGTNDTRERVSYMKYCISKLMEKPNGLANLLRMRQAQHDYSLNNVLTILTQDPDATLVGPASMWRAMGYEVKDGESPIMTWVPRTFRRRKRDENGNFVTDDDGKKVYEGPSQTTFKLTGQVYDIRQTTAPRPEPVVTTLKGDAPAELKAAVVNRAADLGIPVKYSEASLGGANGYYSPNDGPNGSITILATNDDAQQVKTLIHELAHSQDPGLRDGPSDEYRRHRGEAEAVAEATAYTIAARYGMDTSDYSMGYVGGWLQGNPDKLDKVFDRIDAATKAVLPPSAMQRDMTVARERAKEQFEAKKAEKRKAKAAAAA